jgi:hypothetical protein
MALSANGQVVIVIIVTTDTLCCIQYRIYYATHMQLTCNFFVINFHVKFSRTFQSGKQNANVVFHPFVDR